MTIDHHILKALRRIIRATDLHSRQLARNYGLTGPQLLLLRQLQDSGSGLTVGELASRMAISQPTVTGIVTRLERRRFLSRKRSERDRRCVVVRITPMGAQALRAAPEVLQEQFLQRLAALPAGEQQHLLAALERIVSLLEADHLDAAPMLVSGAVDSAALRGVASPLDKDQVTEAKKSA